MIALAMQRPAASVQKTLRIRDTCCALAALLLAACSSMPVERPSDTRYTPPPVADGSQASALPLVATPMPPALPCPARGINEHCDGPAALQLGERADAMLAAMPATASEPESGFWQRLQAGLAMSPCTQGTAVQQATRTYLRSPTFFNEMLEDRLPLIHFVGEEILRRGLPSELLWLPMVESSYVPLPARGRLAGMWQIAQITSGELDLRRDLDYDARIDPVSSTRAALDLLQHLHSQLHEDWRLAILGYNAGEFALKNALARHASSGVPADVRQLRLRAHTYQHLERTLALACIMAEPERFGVILPELDHARLLALVKLDHPVDLRLAARLSGMEVQDLMSLNAGFLQPVTPMQGPHRLLLPSTNALRLSQSLAGLPSPLWRDWAWLQLRSDTRVDALPNPSAVPLTLLSRVNGVPDATHSLRRGERALVHHGSQQLADVEPAVRLTTHRVQSGDTLWQLARRYRVSVEQLREWNRLGDSSRLRVGQTLNLQVPYAADTREAVELAIASTAVPGYVVRPRDSIWLIARRHGLRAQELMSWNGISDPASLRVGMQLRLSPPSAADEG